MELTSIPMKNLMELLTVQLEQGGRAPLVVTGNSMYPTLRHRRDRVDLVPTPAELKRGDLILYRREGDVFVLHRIVSKPRNGAFICCGDNQWEREPVSQSQVLALVDGFTRGKKYYPGTAWTYRLWVAVWVALFPVRRPLLALRRSLGRLKKKLR